MRSILLTCLAMMVCVSSAGARQTGCNDFTFPVYFKSGSSLLAPAAKSAIATAARQFRKCRLASITVVGLSSPELDKNLTEVRLHAVVDEMARRGLRRPRPSIAGAIIAKRRMVMPNKAEVEIAVLH